jgi:hypothetical protein
MSTCSVCKKEIPKDSPWRCDTCKQFVCSESCAIRCHNKWTTVPGDPEPLSTLIACLIHEEINRPGKADDDMAFARWSPTLQHLTNAYKAAVMAEFSLLVREREEAM